MSVSNTEDMGSSPTTVPYGPLAQLVRASGSCLNKLEGNREGNLTYQEGNKLVYGEPADREFEPRFKHQTGRSKVRVLGGPPNIYVSGGIGRRPFGVVSGY